MLALVFLCPRPYYAIIASQPSCTCTQVVDTFSGQFKDKNLTKNCFLHVLRKKIDGEILLFVSMFMWIICFFVYKCVYYAVLVILVIMYSWCFWCARLTKTGPTFVCLIDILWLELSEWMVERLCQRLVVHKLYSMSVLFIKFPYINIILELPYSCLRLVTNLFCVLSVTNFFEVVRYLHAYISIT